METVIKPYNDFYAEAMEHYGTGDYDTVYSLLTSDGGHYPDHAPEILYLRSCMAARAGEDALAISILRDALAQGTWYGEGMMRLTPSWKHLQGRPDFEEVVKDNKACEDQANISPQLFISEPDGNHSSGEALPTLLALHGNGGNARETLEGWHPILAQGWLLAAAQSSQAGMTNLYRKLIKPRIAE